MVASKFSYLSNCPLNTNKSIDSFQKAWSWVHSCFLATAGTRRLTTPGWNLAAVFPACKTWYLHTYLPHTKFWNSIDDIWSAVMRMEIRVNNIIGGSYHKYHFCHGKSFVATKHVFCRDKNMLFATKVFIFLFFLSRQNCCHDKHNFVATICFSRQNFCHDKHLSRQT